MRKLLFNLLSNPYVCVALFILFVLSIGCSNSSSSSDTPKYKEIPDVVVDQQLFDGKSSNTYVTTIKLDSNTTYKVFYNNGVDVVNYTNDSLQRLVLLNELKRDSLLNVLYQKQIDNLSSVSNSSNFSSYSSRYNN